MIEAWLGPLVIFGIVGVWLALAAVSDRHRCPLCRDHIGHPGWIRRLRDVMRFRGKWAHRACVDAWHHEKMVEPRGGDTRRN
jgi:hypothetical protein